MSDFPRVTNNPSGFKLTDTQLSGNNALGKPNVRSMPNVANPKSIGQPTANGFSQLPTNPKYTPFTNYSPSPATVNVPQAVQTTATTVSGFSKFAPVVKGFGLVGALLSAPSIISDVGAGLGYLWNLPQNISNELEKNRLNNLLKQKQARDADSDRINNNGASRLPDNYVPPFAGGQMEGIQYRVFGTASGQYISSGARFAIGFGDYGFLTATGKIRGVAITYGNPLPNGSHTFSAITVLGSGNVNVFGTTDTNVRDLRATITKIERVSGVDTGGDIPNPNPQIQPILPPPPVYPTADNFPYRPTVNVNDGSIDGAPIPQLAKDNWAKNGLKPFAEKVIPPSLNLSDPPKINDKQILKNSSGFPQIQSPPVDPYDVTENGIRTIRAKTFYSDLTIGDKTYKIGDNAVVTSFTKPSFTARPFVSGVSDPSEIGNPRDVNTGLTRGEQDAQWQAQNQSVQDRAKANERAAAANDAKSIAQQLANLSDEPRADLGGKSARQQQTEAYQTAIRDNPIRSDAFRTAQQQTTATQNTTPSTPAGNNVIPTVVGLAGIAATIGALKIGSDLLVNNSVNNTPKINNINANTTPQAQQANSKQGVCDAMQPNQCGFEGVVAATNPIKDIATSNAGLLATILGNLGTLATLIVTNFTKLFTFLDINAKVEAVKSTLTLALTIHNALMLSQSLGDTLGLIIDNVLNVFGNTFRSTEGTQISASQYLGAQVQQWIVNVIGAENYVKLTDVFATANRIYQTGMNIVSTVQSILDSAASVAQATGINVAKIGNALRDESVVSPRAYTHMDDTKLGNRPTTLSRFTALTTTISDLDTKAQNLVTITAAPIQIKDAVKQSKDDIKAFNDARDSNSVEAKAARDAKLEEIKALKPLTEATVGKRDDDT